MPSQSTPDVSYRGIFRLAWPFILANASVPTLGLVDTAVIGHVGAAADLGAIALGALIFSFLYWTFGFLRMGTTGFVARAAGAGDEPELRASALRGGLLGVAIGGAISALSWLLGPLALLLLSASPEVERGAASYFALRVWGAPATLANFAGFGLLIGLGESRRLLALQILLNGCNIALDLLLAGALGWGVRGIALGTAIAEWLTCVVTWLVVKKLLAARRDDDEPLWPLARARDGARLRETFRANADIMLRTLCLLASFGWFTNQSARMGDVVLAGNHLLLQLVSFAAFFLDGFAFSSESLVGRAMGARSLALFDAAALRSGLLSGATALLIAAAYALLGRHILGQLTDLAAVRMQAQTFLPLAVLYVACSFAAFQLDGIFIGASRTRAMRDASALSLLGFLALGIPLTRMLGNQGLWLAFVGYVVLRALTLAQRLPALRADVGETELEPSTAAGPPAAQSRRDPG